MTPVVLSGSVAVPTLADRLELVDDPEFPGISIVGLGMVDRVTTDGDGVQVDLVPTFRACTALGFIEADVRAALAPVADTVHVRWLDEAWTTDRVRADTRRRLADDFGVVIRGDDGTLSCPVCGSGTEVRDVSASGPTRCRSVAWCDACRNVVEVLGG